MAVRYIAVIAGISVLVLDALLRFAFAQRLGRDPLWLAFGWLLWLALVPVVIRVATAVPYRRRERWRFFRVHIAAALAFHAVHLSLFLLATKFVRHLEGTPDEAAVPLLTWISFHTLTDLLVYGVTLAATQMSLYMRAAKRREEERLALERSLAQAALDRLRLELPVHAVSDRLLEIERTIERSTGRAEQLIEEFADSLRESLNVASVDAAIDQVAQDETEWEEEIVLETRKWSLPLRFLLLFSLLPAYQLFWSVVQAVAAVLRHPPLSWGPVVWSGLMAVGFFPVTLAMVWLGRRVRRVWPLVVCAAILPYAWDGAFLTVRRWIGFSLERTMISQFDPLFFLAVGLATVTYSRHREAAAAAVKVAELETAMLRTRGTLLRLQLNPHFLFNSLNSVVALLEDDAPTAQRMTAELRHFVVRVLERSDREEVALREELDSLAAYVAIENIRFEGRAELVVDVSENAQAALVPSFLLQPLVENALRHGLLPEKGGHVGVHARVRNSEVHITVDDDGRASHRESPSREGLGLSNTRARLAQMYGDEFSFDIAARETGFAVTITLPYRPHAAALDAA
jgi:two-component sensor histidine kinase